MMITDEEISSMRILSLYPAQNLESVKQFIDEADRTGNVQFETRKVRKVGCSYPVQMDLVSVRDENGEILY